MPDSLTVWVCQSFPIITMKKPYLKFSQSWLKSQLSQCRKMKGSGCKENYEKRVLCARNTSNPTKIILYLQKLFVKVRWWPLDGWSTTQALQDFLVHRGVWLSPHRYLVIGVMFSGFFSTFLATLAFLDTLDPSPTSKSQVPVTPKIVQLQPTLVWPFPYLIFFSFSCLSYLMPFLSYLLTMSWLFTNGRLSTK